MKSYKSLSADEFIKALQGEDPRFLVDTHEIRAWYGGVAMIRLENIKVDEDVNIGIKQLPGSSSNVFGWNGPPISFNNRIELENVVLQNVKLMSVESKNHFLLKNVIIEGELDFSNGDYSSFWFENVTIREGLRIFQGKFNSLNFISGDISSINISHPTIKYLQVNQNARIKQLDINTTKAVNMPAGSIYYFGMSLPDDIIVNIDDYNIERLKLKGSLRSSTVILKDITVKELYIDKFFSRGNNTIILSNIKPFGANSILSFTNSYLGNIVFFDIDLSKFKTLNILNTSLIDCVFSNVMWPKHIEVYNIKDLNTDYKTELIKIGETKEQIFSKQRENYRQLKHASSKQGDKAQELIFHSKEMKYLRKSSSYFELNNKGILWLSYLSNNHGINWVISLVWLFVFGALFTFALIFASDTNVTLLRLNDIELYWNWRIFFSILNPTHRLEEVEKQITSISPAGVALDFVSRIVIGFLIYQVIIAFRKFNK